jgi:hypothetical protein
METQHIVIPDTALWNAGLSECELFCYIYLQTAKLCLAAGSTDVRSSAVIMCKHRHYL